MAHVSEHLPVEDILVAVPVRFLVQIATHGKMGTGELATTMRLWAAKICREHGLHDLVLKELDYKIKKSRRTLENLLGKEIMDELDAHIDKGLEKVKDAWDIKEMNHEQTQG